MNHWVIPDIHGCHKTLKSLIENHISLSKEDTITFLGDYVDRGPHSKKVISYIMKLQKEFPNVNCIRGNHEEYMLEAHKREKNRKWYHFFPDKSALKLWKSVGGKHTLRSFKIKRALDIPEKYIKWLENLKYYVLTDKYVIVHAGLNFEIEDPFSDKLAMTQLRNFKVKPEKIGNRKVIHGHVPLSLDFILSTIEDENSMYIALDNGCYRRSKIGLGSLLALEINSLKVVSQVNIDII